MRAFLKSAMRRGVLLPDTEAPDVCAVLRGDEEVGGASASIGAGRCVAKDVGGADGRRGDDDNNLELLDARSAPADTDTDADVRGDRDAATDFRRVDTTRTPCPDTADAAAADASKPRS